jgi:UDP-N-acetylmuramate dehydrogenase
MLLEENKSLAGLTSLGIGGPARWFAEAHTEVEIAEAARWASNRSIPLLVLGGGSNLLVADQGFRGLVLRVALAGIEATRGENGSAVYCFGAGEVWDQCVARSVADGCAGVECLAGIPGTAGGTPVQNVGAYGQEVGPRIERVRAFDRVTERVVEIPGAECGFAYRRSRFNTVDRARFVVTRVDFRLDPGGAPTLRYAELERSFGAGTNPSLSEVAGEVRRIREGKGMLLVQGDPDCRSAGSFFKNPLVTRERLEEIAAASALTPPSFPSGETDGAEPLVKVSAAWLIEQAGFRRGYARGAAGLSSRHTLALINRGGARASDILALAQEIAAAVEERFSVRLEMEPELVGFEVA